MLNNIWYGNVLNRCFIYCRCCDFVVLGFFRILDETGMKFFRWYICLWETGGGSVEFMCFVD